MSIPSKYLFLCARRKFKSTRKFVEITYRLHVLRTKFLHYTHGARAGGTFLRQWKKSSSSPRTASVSNYLYNMKHQASSTISKLQSILNLVIESYHHKVFILNIEHLLLILSKSLISIPSQKTTIGSGKKKSLMCPVPIPFGHPTNQPTNTTTHRPTKPPIASFNSSFKSYLGT